MIALQPDPACREGLTPVLFDVTAPAAEIHRFAVQGQRAFERMVETEHAVVAFHARYPGVPAHNSRRKQADRPGIQFTQAHFAENFPLRAVDIDRDGLSIEAVGQDGDSELIRVSLESLGGEGVVGRAAVDAVQHLYESMRTFAQEDARNDGDLVVFIRADEFVVPALEEGWFLARAVIQGRIEGGFYGVHGLFIPEKACFFEHEFSPLFFDWANTEPASSHEKRLKTRRLPPDGCTLC